MIRSKFYVDLSLRLKHYEQYYSISPVFEEKILRLVSENCVEVEIFISLHIIIRVIS